MSSFFFCLLCMVYAKIIPPKLFYIYTYHPVKVCVCMFFSLSLLLYSTLFVYVAVKQVGCVFAFNVCGHTEWNPDKWLQLSLSVALGRAPIYIYSLQLWVYCIYSISDACHVIDVHQSMTTYWVYPWCMALLHSPSTTVLLLLKNIYLYIYTPGDLTSWCHTWNHAYIE